MARGDAVAFGVVALLWSANAAADPLPLPSGPTHDDRVPVHFVAEDGESPYLNAQRRVRNAEPPAGCAIPCTLLLTPGRYRVALDETEDTVRGRANLEIERESRVVVSPDSKTTRTTGLTLGIGGSIVAVTGLIMMIASGDDFMPDVGHGGSSDDEPPRDHTVRDVGTLTMLGGLVIAPIGWILFAGSHRPSLDVRD